MTKLSTTSHCENISQKPLHIISEPTVSVKMPTVNSLRKKVQAVMLVNGTLYIATARQTPHATICCTKKLIPVRILASHQNQL